MGLVVQQIAVGGFDKNFSYLVFDETTRHALVVDPSGDLEAILEAVETTAVDIVGILITHTHHDHIDQLAELLRAYDVPVYVHERGMGEVVSPGTITSPADGHTIPLGAQALLVMHTPGHSDDAVCYFIPQDEAADHIPKLISGDTLFVEGCGRTTEQRVKDLYESLQELKQLPDSTEVYPGHDYGSQPHSTIAHEQQHNPYLQAANLNEFIEIRL